MDIARRAIAALELILIFPAGLFMIALLFRYLPPPFYGPAQTAQQVILWYSDRLWTLWVLLFGLPFAVLVIGCATLLTTWTKSHKQLHTGWQAPIPTLTQPAMGLITAVTLVAGVILTIVAVHILMN